MARRARYSAGSEIRYYTKMLLLDNQEHRYREIQEYVKKHAKKSFTRGEFAGGIRDLLLEDKQYIRTRHGYYMYIKNS